MHMHLLLRFTTQMSLHLDVLERTRLAARNGVDELPADLRSYLRVELYAHDI